MAHVTRLRIALVTGSFPSLSTTFILDQIVGLLALGLDVEVFAQRPAPGPTHEAFARHRLAERTHYWLDGARTPLAVAQRTAALVRRDGPSTLRTALGSLDPLAFGVQGASGRLWCFASTFLARGPFDVVLCHFGEQGLRADALRRVGACGAPIVTVFHGYDVTRFVVEHGRGVYARLFEGGEQMLAVSEHFRNVLVSLGCPASKVQVHRMGVDLEAIPFLERRLAPGDPARLLSVARLTEKKGIEFALRALASPRLQGASLHYDVVGDGPLRESLEQLARRLDVERRVSFHGGLPREKVDALRKRAHVLLAPSVTAADGDQEGIPIAIMEAMASGMPVVSTVHTGIPELVADGVTGQLVKERDVDGTAAAIARVLGDHARWPDIGLAARRIVETRYDQRRLYVELAEILGEIASRHRAKSLTPR